MLGYFPPSYVDECFYSICARYQERIQPHHSGDESILRWISGAYAPIHLQWPTRLQYLVAQLPEEFSVTVESIIDENTLAPMMRPFLSSETYAALRSYMSGSDLRQRLGMIGSAHEKIDGLKYCAFCAKEDRTLLREAYWHRLHQTSIVQVCPKHNCYLSYATRHKSSDFCLTVAEKRIPITEPIRVAKPDDPYDALLLWMAHQVKWLLDHPAAKIDATNLSTAYMQGFWSKGLLTLRGKPDFGRIREQLNKVIGDHIKSGEHFIAVYHTDSRRSLNRAISSMKVHPGLHLLLMYFLGVDAESLPTKSKLFHFEPGPWPCLNTVCKWYRHEVIQDYCFRADQHGAQVATFRCECGYTYSRQAPDFEGQSRLCPHRIISTGDLWNREFQTLWADRSLKNPEIAQKLGCSTTHIRKMAAILGLPLRNTARRARSMRPVRPSLLEGIRTIFRRRIESIRIENPLATRRDFHHRAPSEMQWLFKHDRNWVEGKLPKSKRWGAKVDWDGRDEQYARRVKSVKASLIASQSDVMFRISRKRIAAALGIDANNTRKGRYARTSRAIQAVVETFEQYKVRKLFWVIENPKAALPSTFSALLYKVAIQPNMRSIPVIAEAMKAAEELFQQRTISGVIAATETAA